MKSAIPHTIFLLAGKTVKSLITQEIAKLIRPLIVPIYMTTERAGVSRFFLTGAVIS